MIHYADFLDQIDTCCCIDTPLAEGGPARYGRAMLAILALALAHGDRFAVVELSIAPEDLDAVWGTTGGWGVIRTPDAGVNWEWWCEGGMGVADADAILAWSAGSAWVGTDRGVLAVGEDCSAALLPGVPEGAEVRRMTRWEDGALVLVRTAEGGGVLRCAPGGCVTEAPYGDGLSPRSLAVDGDRAWLTLVDLGVEVVQEWELAGGTWTVSGTWPWTDGERFLLRVAGPVRLTWRVPLSGAPALLYSDDGGATERVVLEAGSATDPPPGLLATPDGLGLYLGIDTGRTWYSADGGASWTEVSEAAPVVRCGDTVGHRAVACADHWADGFDVARLDLGRPWLPMGCLDAAVPSACAPSCAEAWDGLVQAGASGGGECQPPETEPRGCSAAPAPLFLLLASGRRAGRRHSP